MTFSAATALPNFSSLEARQVINRKKILHNSTQVGKRAARLSWPKSKPETHKLAPTTTGTFSGP